GPDLLRRSWALRALIADRSDDATPALLDALQHLLQEPGVSSYTVSMVCILLARVPAEVEVDAYRGILERIILDAEGEWDTPTQYSALRLQRPRPPTAST
ncbi:MAG: hypothetical protein AB8I80_21230, partial [Anaerolineae bacterium]